MQILSVGSQYPFPTGAEGATANFLTISGNTMQIVIPNISKEELFALKKGEIKAGFLYENGDLLWLFTFFDKKGKVFTLDSPFDARLIPKELIALHDITNSNQRLVIDIHVIDETNTVRVLRSVTMPNSLTLSFMSAVQEQIIEINKDSLSLANWVQFTPDDLTKKTKMYELGK
jgi:hypothetical protein